MPSDRRKRLTLVACVVGSAIVFLDTTVVNVALPALREDLDAGLATQQWVIEAYLLTLGSLLLVGGSLGDLFGRRRVYALGLVGFGATSLLCSVAPSAELLVAARVLQGVAGALLVPSSLAIITATFGAAERGRAIGTWTAWTGISIVFGPALGGILIDLVSWRLVFAMNLPLVALTLVLVARAVEESVDPERPRSLDLPGALLCTVGLGGTVFALIEQPGRGFAHPLVLGPLVVGVAALVGFVALERRVRHPMLPLDLFRSRTFSAANAATLFFYAGLNGTTLFTALFLQQVAGYSAFASGLALMPITLVLFLLSRRFGALTDRIGPRVPMTAGPLLGAVGLILLLRVGPDPVYVRDVLPAVLVFGLGLSLTVAPLTATALGAVEGRHAGVASGVNNAVARVAGLVAIAVVGAVVAGAFSSTLDGRLEGERLSPGARAAVEEARTRPLVALDDDVLAPAERHLLAPAVVEASVAGFRRGLWACALMLVAAALVAAFGLEPRRARPERVVRSAHAARDGRDAPVAPAPAHP